MNYQKKGFILIEVVIATALVSIFTISLIYITQKSLILSDRSLKNGQASFLLEEGAEVVKIIRGDDWDNIGNLSSNMDYYLYYDENLDKWSLSNTPNNIDDFTRKIIFNDVYRDVSDDISSSGTLDIFSKKVDIIVSYDSESNNISKQLSFYIFNLFD